MWFHHIFFWLKVFITHVDPVLMRKSKKRSNPKLLQKMDRADRLVALAAFGKNREIEGSVGLQERTSVVGRSSVIVRL